MKITTTLFCFVTAVIINLQLVSAQTATAPSGSGTSGNPYQITSLNNLYWLAERVNGGHDCSGEYFIQTADIDASFTSTWDSNKGWMPIGYASDGIFSTYYCFSGNYDGQNHTISNLYMNRTPLYCGGLFGLTFGATISNVGLSNVSLTASTGSSSNQWLGALIGYAYQSTVIDNCYATGSVSGDINVGGLIGTLDGSSGDNSLSNSFFNGTVSASDNGAGGLCSDAGNWNSISKCYSAGSVIGTIIYTGGLIGNCGCTVNNCYSTSTVNGGQYSGGLVGAGYNTTILNYCYATGAVSGTSGVGGLIGYNFTSPTLTGCFWDTQTTGQSTSAGGGTGETTAHMKEASTYTGWSNATWRLADGNYPLLFAPGTFTGAINSDWATAGNWPEGSVPTSSTNVTVPSDKTVVIGPTTSASCKNLTNSGSFTIESSSSGTGSLIVSGTSTGSVNCQRYMTNGKWHLISPTASGQTVANFLTANTNIPTSSTTRGMMDYNTLGNSWNSYYPNTGASGTMDAGKGYAARIATADGTITFTGTLTSGAKTVSLTTTGQGWNCVGNPYSSAIKMNTTADATNNFITVNSSNLDPSYACVYVWDEDATYTGQSCYKVICNSGYSTSKTILAQNYVAPGQGFFVKANSSATNISFTSAMQSQQVSTAFKAPASITSWPGITLIASDETTTSSADIAFNANMSKGLDPTFDAGLLRGTNGLSLYTRLLEDNGVDFAIQCLPEEYDHLVIPVGIDYSSGGKITFSAETSGLPQDCKLVLEDRSTQTYTSLLAGESYSITLPEATFGTGRFYLHVGSKVTSFNTPDVATGSLKVYTDEGAIIIEGEVNSQAIATLYDMQGQKLSIEQLQKGLMNKISCPKSSGVYLLTIQQNGKTVTRKLINK